MSSSQHYAATKTDSLPCSLRVGQKLHQPIDRENACPVAHQGGNVRLLDAEDGRSLCLGPAALLDDFVDSHRQARPQQLLLGLRQLEIGKDVAASILRPD